jgi:excisionase family DNA binding protein
MIDEEMLTVRQVARLLKLSEIAVRRLIAKEDETERLPAVRFSHSVRIREKDFKAWVERHRR